MKVFGSFVVLIALCAASCGGPFSGNAEIVNDRLEVAIEAEADWLAKGNPTIVELLRSSPARERISKRVFKEGSAIGQRFVKSDGLDDASFREMVSEASLRSELNVGYARAARADSKKGTSLGEAIRNRLLTEADRWSDAGAAAEEAWERFAKAVKADPDAFGEVRTYRELHDQWSPTGLDRLREAYRAEWGKTHGVR